MSTFFLLYKLKTGQNWFSFDIHLPWDIFHHKINSFKNPFFTISTEKSMDQEHLSLFFKIHKKCVLIEIELWSKGNPFSSKSKKKSTFALTKIFWFAFLANEKVNKKSYRNESIQMKMMNKFIAQRFMSLPRFSTMI